MELFIVITDLMQKSASSLETIRPRAFVTLQSCFLDIENIESVVSTQVHEDENEGKNMWMERNEDRLEMIMSRSECRSACRWKGMKKDERSKETEKD